MARIKHKGGEIAGKGNYWNFSTGERVPLACEARLPGDAGTVYYKTNPALILAILAAGPVFGLIYAAFLPFIGIAIVTKLVFSKFAGKPGKGLSRVATFNWQSTEAYLAGRRQMKKVTDEENRPAGDNVAGRDAE
ncbi:MAG: hypothetical protein FIA94_03035 [Nitrospirae bacterium]|nr:hypothetical protein [Nitrospirota bacterium]